VDLKQAHPNEPWLWRAQWAAGEIHSSARPGAIAVCALALFWNAIALPSAVPTVLAHNLRYEPKFAPFAIFPIIGFGLTRGRYICSSGGMRTAIHASR